MSEPIAPAEYVLWAYRLLLGREPEDLSVVESWPDAGRREIVARFLASAEFQDQHEAGTWGDGGSGGWLVSEMENGTRFWVRGDDRAVSRRIARGEYAPAGTAFVRRQLRRGMNAVDVGAGVGWFTVNMAMLVGAAGRVDAFEPREDVAHYLRRTVAENRLGNVVVHRCALAAADGNGAIAFDERDLSPGAARLVSGDAAPPGATVRPVALRRLDAIVWGAVDFIRINAEGAEKLVLEGAEILLARDRPVILAEVNEALLQRASQVSAAEYLGCLAEIDYEVRKVTPNGRCGDYASPDDIAAAGGGLSLACIPAERASEILVR
jgi:FkbM family methyltransferase